MYLASRLQPKIDHVKVVMAVAFFSTAFIPWVHISTLISSFSIFCFCLEHYTWYLAKSGSFLHTAQVSVERSQKISVQLCSVLHE